MSDETALYAKLEEVIGLSDKQYGTACRLINDRDTGFIRLLAKRASQPAIEGYLEGTSATGPSDSAALVRQGGAEVDVALLLTRAFKCKQCFIAVSLAVMLPGGTCW